MQEEVENKTVNLAVSTTKLTARALIRGIRWYLMHRNQKKLRKQLAKQNEPIGEQSVKKLLKGGAGTDKIELPDGSAKEFCKIAKQFGVDYAIRKDKTADPPRYSDMLKSQLARGNNGLVKLKYITFGIEAKSLSEAKAKLGHIENSLMNNFKKMDVKCRSLNGKQRLAVMHDMFHMGEKHKFAFEWKWLPESGLSVKDFIAPSSFTFKKNRVFQMGDTYGAMSFLSITASDISDRFLADLLDTDSNQVVTMHIHSVDQDSAIKQIKHKLTELDRSKIEEQKKAVRAGYDMDIIPSDLATYGKDARELLKELQSQNERMFLLTFLIMNTGKNEQELENNIFQTASIAQKHNCNLVRLDYQQEAGLMSSLPLAKNRIEIERVLTTSSTGIFIPFTTQELFQSGEGSLYYGVNAVSSNLIMADRKRLKNPNGLILGTPGSGKSFSAKREIANAFLTTDDDVIILDPESEYSPPCELLQRPDNQDKRIEPAVRKSLGHQHELLGR